jgi:hypothetical protein
MIKNVSKPRENIARVSLMDSHRQLVPEERGGLFKRHAFVMDSLLDEVVGQVHTMGAHVTKAGESDRDELSLSLSRFMYIVRDSRDHRSQSQKPSKSGFLFGAPQELLAAEDAVGLDPLHEHGQGLPEGRGNFVEGLTKLVRELSEEEVREWGTLGTNATKGFDSNRNERVPGIGEGLIEQPLFVFLPHSRCGTRPFGRLLYGGLGEGGTESDIEEYRKGRVSGQSSGQDDVSPVSGPVNEVDGLFFLDGDTSQSGKINQCVPVSIVGVDNVTSIRARNNVITIGVDLVLLTKGTNGLIVRKHFRAKGDSETGLEFIGAEAVGYGGFNRRMFPSRGMWSLLCRDESTKSLVRVLEE